MNKREIYLQALSELVDWDAYLMQESGLPGPRGNLELAQAVADAGDREVFEHLLTYEPQKAPTNTPEEFLAFCGALGLGKLLAAGNARLLPRLRLYAADPRWRMREAVAMALQKLGRADMTRLLDARGDWAAGSWLEQRAAAAALAEPDLLGDSQTVEQVLHILDKITTGIESSPLPHDEDFKTLRKGLGYCWSVAVAALPEAGKPYMEKWFASQDPDVRWVMKENLKKNRLSRMDAAWVERWQAVLNPAK
jgi:hypothetical protein